MQNNEIIKPAKYFSELEKSILLALVEKYKYVLECKKSDARTIALKQRTWQALAHEYNSQPSVSLRDFKQLKKCWENIKARTKKIMAHERREKVKRSVSPLLSTHVLGKEKIASMLPEQLYFLQSPPEEEPEYHPDASAQESFAVSNRELCDDEKEFIHFPVCEGTSQPEPSCSAVRITANKNYRSKTSQEGALKKMHEEEHHQQMSILQLQLIQMNEVHVAKIQQIERECEMAEEEHRIKMEVLNKKKMYWERKLQTFTKEWPVSSFNRPFPNSP
ncbi:myb/SANT-like DNA-binding domain-containing protein 3 [Pongo pygmaeus]|uniref:Myb/SANT-like DNA-binding domain-containing protein 3 n=20 Tax=Catarrhini TaxID=9526 RepID=MSD3_HUMAN|nr:myb/SANT-like DNA-binding domain-containing protein 3 isoform a [Homo sapiens]NP_001185735.1 myb/SANT-like DNA-binding domain-containing protein 3 isoform a [Homo sapiens]NP_542386.1 myb/SANT-like DNA-binding domain-containing protein 3 isoform a [Homo sapiens]XP_003260336.1 myb/SANT-like DNA-binding domain-containing protein 3 [Nomascus leucogenys]XP_003312252.1 myb/SANT-like DNA-binding domain-containing protein 3 isoform X1 [Pan troglodytes]XP_003312253.1 myb/SANT-like DNA-binding domain|eukprot:NP_001185734.1 myb/SANT-like DNA-binding domain-containing protein 3 isoform a [Homo sapiens]